MTFAGTPALGDALAIAATEPWLDVGVLSPQWRIAEWSLMIMPLKCLLVAATGALLATYVVVREPAGGFGSCALTRTGGATMTAFGAALIGLANATLFWVVCCAAPTWVVALAMLGLSASIALLLEPVGPWLTAAGLALLVWPIVSQLRRLASHSAAVEVLSSSAQRSA